ncbi:MAG: DoxX family protein [Candidatus Limnocylindrales bacterium]
MHSVDLAFLLIRVAVGITFAAHGAQKAFGWWGGPGLAKWRGAVAGMGFRPVELFVGASILAELVGGLMLATGILTPVAAALLVAQSVVIIFKVHWSKGFFSGKGGFEFPFVLGMGAIAIGIAGPGQVSLDQLIKLEPGATIRGALLVIGVLGGLASLAVPRLMAERTAPGPMNSTGHHA